MVRTLLAAAVVAVLGSALVAADLKSGPPPGDKVPGAFHPYNVTGEDAGKAACLYCKGGDDPVAVVFARTGDDPMTHKLLKALDAETVKHAKADMFSFAVFTGNKALLEPQLKEAAKKADLKKIVLAIEDATDPIPAKYNLNKDADVTVILYVNRVVKANYSFAKGALTDKDIDAVVKDVSKIVK
ncbi:hypothetical protein [Frigoriglobus tundricola]|uniref:Thioredoxin domain-containing protein n=1 Tax=Frigoriglobus tundricola TaxID=2774151 RepID=A0A6M5YWK9_9BACT|nr:hypothetical protein [Frigoriglobus tundricola]QJW97312.1 hypothetical protein FTUN_4882 [Frigoriglobus tundricola]